jgi:hypothetical protein
MPQRAIEYSTSSKCRVSKMIGGDACPHPTTDRLRVRAEVPRLVPKQLYLLTLIVFIFLCVVVAAIVAMTAIVEVPATISVTATPTLRVILIASATNMC